MPNFTKPNDLMDTLVSNHKAGKPLLDGAQLYRGSRLPDQALGHFGPELHTSLLPQVAASYTHNWQEKDAYIGAYAIDRERTRFYPDFGMEKVGGMAKSYSVSEVEQALAPLVDRLAAAKTPQERMKAAGQVESLLKSSFYEAGVPARTASGDATRPDQLFVYTGRPDIAQRQAVTMQMRPMTAEHELQARWTMANEHKSPATQAMVGMLAHRTEAAPAIAVVIAAAQREHSAELMRDHFQKPLGQMLKDVDRLAPSDTQLRLERFARALNEGAQSENSTTRSKAQAVAREVAKLDPRTVTFEAVAAASRMASSAHSAGHSSSLGRGDASPGVDAVSHSNLSATRNSTLREVGATSAYGRSTPSTSGSAVGGGEAGASTDAVAGGTSASQARGSGRER